MSDTLPVRTAANSAWFDLLPSLVATLTEQGLERPTEIQAAAIPELRSGRSVVGIAETGSGKTLAYSLPMLHLCKSLESGGFAVEASGQPRGLILVPTRELGEQVSKVLKTLTHGTRVRVRSALGGTTAEIARRNVSGPFEVLVGTPGRIKKQLEAELIRLSDVRMLVLDEVDQMLDLGFLPDVSQIIAETPPSRQLALFSATVAPKVEELIARLFGPAPRILRTKGSNRVVASLKTVNRTVVDGDRFKELAQLLRERTEGGTILFANTRDQCDVLAEWMKSNGHAVALYRGEMDKVERRANLESFRKGEVHLLITTDLGSRGLDLPLVGRVINVHLCTEMKNYLHRVGRTARAGRPGLVVNLVTERDLPLIDRLQGRPPRRPDAEGQDPRPAAPPRSRTNVQKYQKAGSAPDPKRARPADPTPLKPGGRGGSGRR